MNQNNTIERKTMQRRFAGLYIVSIALLAIIFSAFWDRTFSTAPAKHELQNDTATLANPVISENRMDKISSADQILLMDEALRSRLTTLQQLDSQYVSSLKDSVSENPDRSVKINVAENVFKKTIDSVAQQAGNYNGVDDKSKVTNMVLFYQSALQQHYVIGKAVSSLHNAVANHITNLTTGQQTLAALQNNLYEKDNQIAELETKLKSHPDNTSDQKTVMNLQNSLRQKDAQIAELQTKLGARKKDNSTDKPTESNDELTKRNARLVDALNLIENRYVLLVRENNELKQDNERLNAQLKNSRKPGNTSNR